MKDRYLEDIDQEIIDELSGLVFTRDVDLKKWDAISVSNDGEYIEIYRESYVKEPVYASNGELKYYNYNRRHQERRYRRDKWSGEYFEY